MKNIPKLLLEVTQDCNLRCKYCIYNENYFYQKKLTKKSLNYETAKKGLEYIHGFIKDKLDKSFSVSFYGGEPFIQFELIKKIVSYTKTLFNNWDLHFGATSNATLLRDEIIDYLIAENFTLLISLDGPAKNHDSKRVYRNGKGTFKKLWGTLKRIKDQNPDYFIKRISFNIVHSLDQSMADLFKFFTENESLNMNKVNYNQVISKNTDYYDKINYDIANTRNDFKYIFDKLISKQQNMSELTPLEKKIRAEYLEERLLLSESNSIYDGTCFFDSRVFIDVNGQFHVCESINDKFPLGDVWQGFDFKKMVEIVKRFADIKKEFCFDCDINYLCRPCYLMFAEDGVLNIDRAYCANSRSSIITKFQYMIHIEEKLRTTYKAEISKIYRFHQFVTVVDGPVNSAIVNFINGDIYHVQKKILRQFEAGDYDNITEFIEGAKEAGLIIFVNSNTWIPNQNILKSNLENFDDVAGNSIVLCIEEGIDLQLLKPRVSKFKIQQIMFYGSNFESQSIENWFPGINVFYEEIDYQKCSNLCTIKKGNLIKTDREFYNFAQVCNNCWGHKISITKDGKIRPCIFSNIIIEDLEKLNDPKTIKQIKSYWYITKDKIEKCKECELRYFCIDCREKAQRENNGNLYTANLYCNYNPQTGIWKEDQ